MGLILDCIIVLIIALCVFLSARYGFIRTLIETVGYFLSFIVATLVADPVSKLLFTKIVEPFLQSAIENTLTDAADDLFENLPSYFSTLLKMAGLDNDSLSEMLTAGISSATVSLMNAFEPYIINMICAALTAMLTVLLIVLVFLLAKHVNSLCKDTSFGKTNRVIGGLIGLLKGIVISILFVFFVGLCVAVTGDGFLIFTNEAIDSSYICRFIFETFNHMLNGGLPL